MAIGDRSPRVRVGWRRGSHLLERLNGPWHKPALQAFMVVVLAHWVEHLLQAIQVYALGWHRPFARGALGYLFPWLVTSEWLHYAYALVMLIGLAILRPGFVGAGFAWWNLALGIQFWHHFEHALLLGQALAGKNLVGAAVPTSVLQLAFPRIELHLFYNAVVFIPMLIGLYVHLHRRGEAGQAATCGCRKVVAPLRAAA